MADMKKDSIFFGMSQDAYKISRSNRLIEVATLLSFLTVDTERTHGHIGESREWTRHEHKPTGLVIHGGYVSIKGVATELVDSIEFGTRLENSYNNFVNPFFLMPIMNNRGKRFFLRYYDGEINEWIGRQKAYIDGLKQKTVEQEALLAQWLTEIREIEEKGDKTNG